MHNISIFGTSSDAGKSTLTFVIGRIVKEAGYSVAPFKAQNVSNNAHVCDDNSEIGIAQYFQAEVLGVPTSYHLNPILLKSGKKNSASLIVNGKAIANKDVHEYYRDLDLLKPAVDHAFNYLDERYDCVICEGAGSPVELNLMDKDLSNIYMATKFKTKIILVADIEKGGVFASIWGVYNLLPKELQENVIGVIVNKFRGDLSLFDKGIEIIEKEFNIPVLGVLPYVPFNLGFEDSQSLFNYQQETESNAKKIAVLAYPSMSNYNDLEPLIANPKMHIDFVTSNVLLENYELVILPGSKQVMKDLTWLKEIGLFEQLQKRTKDIFGICGGYQMLFKNIHDHYAIESEEPKSMKALGHIDDDIFYRTNKILNKGEYCLWGTELIGFEIHHGTSKKYPLYYFEGNIKGTFIHALFENEVFQSYKEKTINTFVNTMKEKLEVERILKSLD
ncbi:MAG: Cobyric acid synthase (EC [uncultured Sulfurovum sp.]|uniref:Cobyric acid synthase n=1 Tax=uncultured Sulfurovum sp. TaxID=269237 RepID=A0A6S6RZU4_9BACT|nr:MAG: Cobyric acid synthase (EC [uncultured Sulfurovum sp.]